MRIPAIAATRRWQDDVAAVTPNIEARAEQSGGALQLAITGVKIDVQPIGGGMRHRCFWQGRMPEIVERIEAVGLGALYVDVQHPEPRNRPGWHADQCVRPSFPPSGYDRRIGGRVVEPSRRVRPLAP